MYNTTYFEKYHDVQLTSLSLKYRGFCQGKKMPPHFAYTKNLPIFRSIEGGKKELENGRGKANRDRWENNREYSRNRGRGENAGWIKPVRRPLDSTSFEGGFYLLV